MKKQKNSKSKSGGKKTNNKSKNIGDLISNHADSIGITPLNDRVLIRPLKKEDLEVENSFGIIIPNDKNSDNSAEGIVLAVGNGLNKDGKIIPLTIKVGDRVAYSRFGYEEIKYKGEEYIIVKEENILAIFK